MALTYEEFQKLAQENYTKGGDRVVECWDKKAYIQECKANGPITKKRALEIFKLYADVDGEYREAAKYFSGESY